MLTVFNTFLLVSLVDQLLICRLDLQGEARFKEAGVQVPTPQSKQDAAGSSSSSNGATKAAERPVARPCDVSASPIKVCGRF